MGKNIFISAGDISGDFHAANLIRALKQKEPDISVTSLGGRNLSAVSDNFLANICELGGFGFFSPFRLYFLLKAILERTESEWDKKKVDKVVLVDYYGFNIHLAKEAFRRGIPVYYFISPQVWASRRGRVRKLAKFVDKMLVILPFEEKIYKDAGIEAVFVGHPLLDVIKEEYIRSESETVPLIGLFPGSRSGVSRRHMPILEKTAELINNKIQANFRVIVTEPSDYRGISKYPLIKADNFAERSKLTLAITTSGTVSLENALMGIPMVVFYKLSRFNYFIAKLIVKIRHIAMPNILLEKDLVPELIQSEASAQNIAAKAFSLLSDKENIKAVKIELLSLRKKLGSPGVYARSAEIILSPESGNN